MMLGIACFDLESGVLRLWRDGGVPIAYLRAHVPLNKRFSFFLKAQNHSFLDML